MRLDPKLKADWVEALRSGKYKQGRRRLYFAGEYCCLGVLSVLRGDSLDQLQYPDPVMTRENIAECYNRNDGTDNYVRHSFLEIADWLEGNDEI